VSSPISSVGAADRRRAPARVSLLKTSLAGLPLTDLAALLLTVLA
jgi:hypothetical protein